MRGGRSTKSEPSIEAPKATTPSRRVKPKTPPPRAIRQPHRGPRHPSPAAVDAPGSRHDPAGGMLTKHLSRPVEPPSTPGGSTTYRTTYPSPRAN